MYNIWSAYERSFDFSAEASIVPSMERTIENSVLEERTKHALTQEALAQTVGVSRQTILAIEKGKYTPSVALALRIAHAFGVRVEAIFHLTSLKK